MRDVRFEALADYVEVGGMLRRKDASAANPSPVLTAREVYELARTETKRLRAEVERLREQAAHWTDVLTALAGDIGPDESAADSVVRIKHSVERLKAALRDAAKSLESASRHDRVASDDVRNYCLSRAMVAREALGEVE